MNFLHQSSRKLSSDRQTETDTTEIIYHAASRVVSQCIQCVLGFSRLRSPVFFYRLCFTHTECFSITCPKSGSFFEFFLNFSYTIASMKPSEILSVMNAEHLIFESRAFRLSAPRVWNSLPVSIYDHGYFLLSYVI